MLADWIRAVREEKEAMMQEEVEDVLRRKFWVVQ